MDDFHVFVGPKLESRLFRDYQEGTSWCEARPGWEYVGRMEALFNGGED